MPKMKVAAGTSEAGTLALYPTELHPIARMAGIEPATSRLAFEVSHLYATQQFVGRDPTVSVTIDTLSLLIGVSGRSNCMGLGQF